MDGTTLSVVDGTTLAVAIIIVTLLWSARYHRIVNYILAALHIYLSARIKGPAGILVGAFMSFNYSFDVTGKAIFSCGHPLLSVQAVIF
jgi:hypothetical protein